MGISLSDYGVVQGITYDQGNFYIPITLRYDNSLAKGVAELYIKGEPYRKDHPILKSLDMYPNPFKDEVKIEYILDDKYTVSIKIYDKKGKLINILQNEEKNRGLNELYWNGLDALEEKLDDGWYYVQFNLYDGNDFIVTDTRKMLKLSSSYVDFW